MSDECFVCRGGDHEDEPILKQRKTKIIAVSGLLLFIGLVLEFNLSKETLATAVFLFVTVLAGHEIIKKAYNGLLKRRMDMNFLMTIAASGAFLIGHGEEGAAIMFLFSVAEFLEDYATDRARNSVRELMKLAPDMALVLRDGEETQVLVGDIEVSEMVVIKPGDSIPLDGIVTKGSSSVNQASITGESIPVSKRVGEEVFAGTINEEGYLEFKVTKKSSETLLSKMVKLVSEAQKDKSKTERSIEKFARVYTPTVVLLAILVATVPTIVFKQPFSDWIYRALTLLVVSCPCALVISTPVSVVSGITSAARHGVLIKGGSYVEEVHRIKAFAFDKTGTLTEGRPSVTDILSFNGSEENILSVAATLEGLSNHPLAQAILEKAAEKNIRLKEASGFKSITGKGVKGVIDGRTYYAGSHSLFEDMELECPGGACPALEEQGKTMILVGSEEKIFGAIGIADRIRDSTKGTIKSLKERDIENIMLTGDNERTTKAIAGQIGVTHFHAQLSPEDKVKRIEHLRDKHGHVLMIGDGVNDAPALAKANIGVAMGVMGSDVALETADIALIEDDLSKLPYLVDLSKKTVEVMKENVGLSILVKGTLAALTLVGLVKLWMAVAFGDMGLTLAVILNAMRISRIKAG